jgi:hypothetical protein
MYESPSLEQARREIERLLRLPVGYVDPLWMVEKDMAKIKKAADNVLRVIPNPSQVGETLEEYEARMRLAAQRFAEMFWRRKE